MPDRIIKESCCTSDTLNRLSDFEERFWWRLTVNCDDYGRFDARPAVLKSRLFPLMEGKTLKNMEVTLQKLASVGLVRIYEVDKKPFLQVVSWDKHQRIRAKRSKFPPPPEGSCGHLTANDDICGRNPIQSKSESRSESESIMAEAVASRPETAAESEPPVITLPLNTGEEFPIFQSQLLEFCALYPAVDVMQSLRDMRGWLIGNPRKRKTDTGILRFVTSWLKGEQDRGGSSRTETGKASGNVFLQIMEERREQL